MGHSHSTPLQVRACRDGVVTTVTVAGELDLTNAHTLTGRLVEVAAGHPERLVLDLAGLVFVDVAGARALHCALRALQDGCPVILRKPRPSARKVFRLTGLMGG